MNRSRVTGDLASQGNIFVDIANDRVGIGSTIPTQKLDVTGTVKATTFVGDGSSLTGIDAGTLKHNNNTKAQATAYGVEVTGTTDTDGLIVSGVSTFSNRATITHDLTISGTAPRVIFTDTDNNPDYRIDVDGGSFSIQDTTNGNANRFVINNAGNVTVPGNFDTVGNIAGFGDLTLTDTTADSAAGPEFKLFRNSASPADADYLGQIKFAGESDTGVERNYAKITGKILDASNGTEDGILEFAHIKAGSQTITGRWRSDSLQLLNDTNLTVDGNITVNNSISLNSDDSSPARIDLYCEVSNAHYTRLQAPAHSTYSGNVTVTIPNTSGNLAVLANAANNRIVTATGTHGMTGESNLTYDGTTLQAITSGSGTREQLNLKNQNASAGTSRINFFSTVSGTEFVCAGIRNGVNTVNQGRLFLQVNKGSGLTNALEIDETGVVKVTNGSLQVEGGGLGFLTNNSTIQTGSSGYMLGIQGGATNMGGRIEFRGGNSDGDIRMFAQGATSTQVERLRIDSSGRILIGLTSASNTTTMVLQGNSSTGATGQAILNMNIGTTSISDGTSIGVIRFGATGDRRGADIKAEGAGTWSAGSSHPIDLIFATNPSGSASTPPERMRITSAGNVSIHSGAYDGGGTAPQLYVRGTGGRQVKIHNSNAGTSSLQITNGTTGQGEDAGTQLFTQGSTGDFFIYNAYATGDIAFGTKPSGGSTTERLRIASTGMVEMRSDMSASDQANRNIFRFTDTDTSTVADQSMGRLQWFSSDGSGGGACVKAEIEAVADDTTPEARIIFKTHTGSGTTPTERMSIRNNGDVAVNTSGARIYTNSSNGNFKIMGGSTYPGGMIRLYGGGNGGSGHIAFHAGQTTSEQERMRLDASGRFLVGKTSSTLNPQVQIGGRYVDSSSLTIDLDTTGSVGPCLELFETGNTVNRIALMTFNHGSLKSAIGGGRVNTNNWGTDIRFFTHPETTNQQHFVTERMKINSSGNLVPAVNDTYDLGASALRWQNVYTTDLQLSNEGKANDVDGTWGDFTIQEGESDLFLINNRSGKKYKFNLTEVS